ERRRRERQLRLLPEPHRLVRRPQSGPPSRPLRVRALEPSQHLVKIKPMRLPLQGAQESYKIGLFPHNGVHRLISPRPTERRTTSTKELIDTCRARNCCTTAPNRKALPPSYASSSTSIVI